MPVPFGTLIPQRSRVLPTGGAVLGGLTGRFLPAFEAGQQRAAEDAAPDLLLNYLDSQAAGYQPTLGRLTPPPGTATTNAPAYNGMPTQANADVQTALTPGSPTFDGRSALRRENAAQQNPAPSAVSYDFGSDTIRNQPVNPDLERALNAAAAATGVSVVVGSGGQPAAGTGGARTGSTRHDDGGAADLRLVVDGRELDFTNPNDLPIIQAFVAAARANGATGFGAGTDYMGNNTLHVGFGPEAVWGAGGSSATAPEWLATAAGGGGPAAQQGGGYSSQPAWTPPTPQERMQLRALMLNPATRQQGFELAVARMTPPAPVQPDPIEINGQLVDRNTGQVLGDYRDPTAAATGPVWQDAVVGGVAGQRNTQTGEFSPYPQYAQQPAAAGEGIRPMTAEERAQWGIAEGDPRVWAFDPTTGEPSVIGGNATPGMALEMGPDGTVRFTQGNVASDRPATEGQANANIYATRMEAASPLIDQFTTSGQNFWSGLVSGLGVVGNIALAEIDPQYQQFAQATRDFINASLRRESGAVISEEEFANARAQYIPQPGDTPETLEQKRQNRARQTEAIRQASGPFAAQGGAAPAAAPASTTTIPPGIPAGAPAATDAQGNWLYWNGTAWVAP